MKLARKKEEYHYIFGADLHLRHDKPLCYRQDIDFWYDVQVPVLKHISVLKKKYKIPFVLAGDLFDRARPPYTLLSRIDEIAHYLTDDGEPFYCIAGNHDLPNHNWEQWRESAWGILKHANVLHSSPLDLPDGRDDVLRLMSLNQIDESPNSAKVLVTHEFVYPKKKLPFPGCDSQTAEELLAKENRYNLIVTGDNHQSFIIEDKKGRKLLNPGCMVRQSVTEMDYTPSVYLWNAETNEIKQEVLPFEYDHISDSHLKHSKEMEERKIAFVTSLERNEEVSLSFVENLKKNIISNKVSPSIKSIISEAIERGI